MTKWLTCGLDCVVPSAAIDESTRERAFGMAVEFIRGVHREYGWDG